MSKSEIYGIYDEATEAFLQFIPAVNDKVARMSLEKMFNDRRITIPLIYDYPGNFKVYRLGSFDDNSGLFDNVPQHVMLLDFGSLSHDNTSIADKA